MTSQDGKKTALFDLHKEAKGKIVPFGGWLMPVSYKGVLAEHKNVREKAGLFDVSHMGEFFVRGEGAETFLQYLTINNVTKLKDLSGQYTSILNEGGGMIDDLILYRIKEGEYLACVNAANLDKDFAWFDKQAKLFKGVSVENESDFWSQVAIQGPNSPEAVKAIVDDKDKEHVADLKYMKMISIDISGKTAWLARTGYTGEIGYELYVQNEAVAECWTKLLATSDETGIMPIGLGARDTLRLEACYLLYGNDMNEEVTPLEAGIGWATKLKCGDFIGKSVVEKQKEDGIPRKILSFKMEDKSIARHDMGVFFNDKSIGKVTSGSFLPSVGGSGGLVMVKADTVSIGDQIEVDIRGKRKLARISEWPLYSARTKG